MQLACPIPRNVSMSHLEDHISADETIVWKSEPSLATSRRRARYFLIGTAGAVVGIFLMLGLLAAGLPLWSTLFGLIGACSFIFLKGDSGTEIAVLPDHVVWTSAASNPEAKLRKVRREDIYRIDAEEGSGALTIHHAGGCDEIENVLGGDVAAFVAATQRPGLLWRRCNSPAADAARYWKSIAFWGICIVSLAALVLMADPVEALLEAVPTWAFFLIACGSAWALIRVASTGERVLPHLLAGRSLTGQDRKDFVFTLTDPRWEGIRPESRNVRPPAPGPVERWAMGVAYGIVPDYEPWEPEIINGPVPEPSIGAKPES